MDFFERQHQAKIQTKKLVFFFVLAVLLIVLALNAIVFFIGNWAQVFQLTPKQWLLSPYSLLTTAATLAVIVIGSLIRHYQVRGGGKAVAEMVGARLISMDSVASDERKLVNVVEEMSIASGMPVPSIYILDNEQGLNAFVAGTIPSDTVLVVTAGLLEKLNRQELQGVVAHEFSHIFHSDMSINMRLIGILGGILAIGQLGYYVLRSMRYSTGGRRRSSKSGKGGKEVIFILALSVSLIAVGYIGMFFGRLIKAAISRQREYLADSAAVQYSRDAMGIANALYKIKTNGNGSLLDSSHAEDMSHMCFGKSIQLSAFSGMLATHPPIDDRIAALVPGYRSIRKQSDEESVDDLSPIAQFSANSEAPVPDAPKVTTATAVVSSIGTVNPTQVETAERIHHEISNELLDAGRNPKRVSKLILALIAQSNSNDWETQKASLKNQQDQLSLNEINQLRQIPIKAEQRIPLVEICVPGLKRLDKDAAKSLLASASLLIVSDKKIVPFEFFLYALLRKHLSKKDAAFEQSTIKSYSNTLDEIEYLVKVIALVGDSLDPISLKSIMTSFSPNWQGKVSEVSFDSQKLHKALMKLNRLTPLLKKPLMLTLAEMVMEDNEVKPAELELLRTTGIYLECPIPPLVSNIS